MIPRMSDPVDLLSIYLHLARASQLRRQPLVRSRLLFLSAAVAAQIDLPNISAFCRQEILDQNPGHLLRKWPTVEEGFDDEGYQSLLRQLARRYPREKGEQMMESLGLLRANERNTYDSAEEYAAALLGHTIESMRDELDRRDSA